MMNFLILAAFTLTLDAQNPVQVVDFGPQTEGGYPSFEAKGIVCDQHGAVPMVRVSYANHPDGISPKGDFWRETAARYLGEDVDLPILPANIDRYEFFDVETNGSYRAKLLQGQVRYARLQLENAVDGASVTLADFRLVNDRVHSEGERAGSFTCSDDRLAKLWAISVRTCEIASIPSYVATHVTPPVTTLPYLADGAKRDRLVWSGDLWWAERNVFYGFKPEAPYLRGSIVMLANSQTPDGYVQACPWPEQAKPTTNDYGPFGSDEFAVWFVPVTWDYILYTDDRATAEKTWPTVTRLMDYLVRHTKHETGILEPRRETSKHAAGLAFGATSLHHRAYVNILIWKAWCDAAQLAAYLGHDAEATAYRAKAEQLKANVNRLYWNGAKGWFRQSIEEPDVQAPEANPLALATGFATREQAAAIVPNLKYHHHGKFQLMALRGCFAYGYDKKAMELFAEHGWFQILDPSWKGAQTTSECMGLIHDGWGDESHPDTAVAGVLSTYVLGVEPLTPGFRTFRVSPHPAGCSWAEGRVPTPKGEIYVKWTTRADGTVEKTVCAPSELKEVE